MRNLVQDGAIIELTAPYAGEPGDLIVVGNIVGAAVGKAELNKPVQVRLYGVYSGWPVKSGDSFSAGDVAYFHPGQKKLTVDADDGEEEPTPYVKVGVALGGGKFRLNGAF
jgi:predicted RecA/RadA family phage recombinase